MPTAARLGITIWTEKGWMSGGMEEMALQRQEAGDHYRKMKIQPIEYIMANDLDYLSGNIIKYASRHKSKGGAGGCAAPRLFTTASSFLSRSMG